MKKSWQTLDIHTLRTTWFPDIHRLGKAADSLESTYNEQDVPEWWKSKLSVTAKDADTLADSLDYVAENPSATLPIFAGEPTSKFTNKGMVTAEVQIGRGILKDIGEGIQDVYRGIIGGRQTMTEKRMAMAVATMKSELSKRAKKLGANAIANISIDYEYPAQGDITLIATADAIKMTRPPKQNPGHNFEEDFERIKEMAYQNLTKKIQGEDPDYSGQEWWNEQKPWIKERYGEEPLNVSWAGLKQKASTPLTNQRSSMKTKTLSPHTS